jgi:hypothetical protein
VRALALADELIAMAPAPVFAPTPPPVRRTAAPA